MTIQRGSAGITITLHGGDITVTHSDGGPLLILKRVPEGTWDRLWDFLRSIPEVPLDTTGRPGEPL